MERPKLRSKHGDASVSVRGLQLLGSEIMNGGDYCPGKGKAARLRDPIDLQGVLGACRKCVRLQIVPLPASPRELEVQAADVPRSLRIT